MKLELSQRQAIDGRLLMEFQRDRMGSVYEVLDYWERQPKLEARVNIAGE